MVLAAGRRLGAYEILSPLGAGGMGEVYRARDNQLGRDVAIKVLPDAFAQNQDRLARFSREARALAALNHPNIAAVHGFEQSDAARFLVMELVAGETLAERIRRGPLAVDEALSLAHQIADALEEAHAKGIVHRDLKPANVKVSEDGKLKVLDFGLAKALGDEVPSGDASRSPTLTATGGVILGTAAYMSPEQARGKNVDKRTDVWAFGCVLYEMLTGKRAFDGETTSDLVAAILGREPDWSALPPRTPARLRELLRRCLQKDAHRRVHDIADARIELEEVRLGDAPTAAGVSTPRGLGHRERFAWGFAAAALSLVSLTLWRTPDKRSPPLQMRRFTIHPPDGASLAVDESPVLSPDGRRLAFVASDASGMRHIWVRDLDVLDARPLAGTQGVAWAAFPFWSPDGQSLGFFADGQLKKVALSGGPAISLAPAIDARGASWSKTGVIIFSPSLQSPLYRMPDQGGAATPLTSLNASEQEVSHRLPSFLPDGRRFLFVVQSGTAANNGLYVGSLDSPKRVRVGDVQSKAVFIAPGFLVYTRGATLVAQGFDPESAQLSGDAWPVGEPVAVRIGVFGERAFTAASDGTMAYWSGGGSSLTEIAWFDRRGRKLETVGEPGAYQSVGLSPDGTKLAFERWDDKGIFSIWVHDFKRGVRAPFSARSSTEWGPIWSPNGDRVVFGSLRRGVSKIYWKAYPGGEDDQVLLDKDRWVGPTDWSSDGRSILFTESDESLFDVGVLTIGGQARPVLTSRFVEKDARFSPDGRWLTYTSNESGPWEVWLQSYPEASTRIQISTKGGSHPEWEASGKELFYLAPDNTIMATALHGVPANEPPRPLFRAKVAGHWQKRSYAVTRGGQRFLIIVTRDKESLAPITVVTNGLAPASRN